MLPVFAFGSNLDRSQMRHRCPSARLVAPATLPGHALVFVGHSLRWDGAVATVRPRRGSAVLGALYDVSPEDRLRLDSYEAGYRRVRRRVRTPSGFLYADLYVRGFARPSAPSAAYLEAIARGYASLGYSLAPLAPYRSVP